MFVILETGWLVISFFKNSDKTETCYCTKNSELKTTEYNLSINGFTVKSSSTVRNLCFIFHSNLSFYLTIFSVFV